AGQVGDSSDDSLAVGGDEALDMSRHAREVVLPVALKPLRGRRPRAVDDLDIPPAGVLRGGEVPDEPEDPTALLGAAPRAGVVLVEVRLVVRRALGLAGGRGVEV